MGKKCGIMGLCQPAEVVELGRHAVLRGAVGASPCGFKSRSRHQRGPGRQPAGSTPGGTGHKRGDVAKWTKAEVCKTSIRRFESARRLHPILSRCRIYFPLCCLYPLPTFAETSPGRVAGVAKWQTRRT